MPEAPSRPAWPLWAYLPAPLLMALGLGWFAFMVGTEKRRAADEINAMQRLVAPGWGDKPDAAAGNQGPAPLDLAAGEYTVFYESFGTYNGTTFDTPPTLVRPAPDLAAMELTVTPEAGGEPLPVRLAGYETDPDERAWVAANQKAAAIRGKNRGLVIYRRQGTGRDGQAIWMFDVPAPGRYLLRSRYMEGVDADPATIEVPPPPRGSDLRLMTEAQQQEARRPHAEALARHALAELEPKPVLLAVGRDPIGQRFFDPFALRGAATLGAFGLTFGLIWAVVVWMIRNRPQPVK